MAVKADWAVGLIYEHDAKCSGLAYHLFLCSLFSSQSMPRVFCSSPVLFFHSRRTFFLMYYVYFVPFYCVYLRSLFFFLLISPLPPLCGYLYLTSSSTFNPHPFVLQHFFGHMHVNKSRDLNCYHGLLEQFKSF